MGSGQCLYISTSIHCHTEQKSWLGYLHNYHTELDLQHRASNRGKSNSSEAGTRTPATFGSAAQVLPDQEEHSSLMRCLPNSTVLTHVWHIQFLQGRCTHICSPCSAREHSRQCGGATERPHVVQGTAARISVLHLSPSVSFSY